MELAGTPIMEYVRTLESKCRKYERTRQRLDFTVFAFGLAVGAVTASVCWWYMLRG